MRLRFRLPDWLHGRTIVAGVLAAGIVHIALTLASAHLSTGRTFDAVARRLPANQMQVMPPTTVATQFVPFQSPDMRYAMCRFDASEGTVLLRAALPGLGWSVSIHSPAGDNFFVITGQEGRRTELGLLLVPHGEEFVPLPRESTGAQGLAQVALPAQQGLVMIRAPIPGAAYRAEVEAELARATCQLRRR